MTDSSSGSGPNVDSGIEKLWHELRGRDPRLLGARTGVSFDAGCYTVPFLSRNYRVDPDGHRIHGSPGDPLLDDPEFRLLVLGYLVHARGGEPSGSWVTQRQLPGGSLFFQGPHALPVAPLVERYGRDADAFRLACAGLGGAPVPFGDAGFSFRALPLVSLALLLWVADEEFPARAGVLFDSTVALHLPLDLVLALVHAVVARLSSPDCV